MLFFVLFCFVLYCILFKNYTSLITYNVLAVTQNINKILYDCSLSNLQINMLTTFINVECNKMLETLIFQQSYVQYLNSNYTHPINILSKAKAALVKAL